MPSALTASIDSDAAIEVARLFWPALVLHEGWVFLADGFTESAFETWKASDFFVRTGMRGICAAMTHRHVRDLLPRLEDGLPPETVAYLGYVIGSCWEARLREAFPERHFEFERGAEIWFWEGAPADPERWIARLRQRVRMPT